MLHEHLSLSRWVGILLLTSAVGFVADTPARTTREPIADAAPPAIPPGPGVAV